MKHTAKQILRYMVNTGQSITEGYDGLPRIKNRIVDIGIFYYLLDNGYIIIDRNGKFLVSKKGLDFITPWYRKIFNG